MGGGSPAQCRLDDPGAFDNLAYEGMILAHRGAARSTSTRRKSTDGDGTLNGGIRRGLVGSEK